jgi:hypothetical protein
VFNGSIKITRELRRRNHHVNRKTVARLMQALGIRSKVCRKFRVQTTDSNHANPISPNTLNQNFAMATGPDQCWGADITYISTGEGFLYLAGIMDLYSRKIVGWSTSQMLATELVERAMMAALQAHISEHLAFEYRNQIEEQAGVPYPAPDAKMDEETEVQISRLAAAAAQQLTQKNQAQAAQQKAQQMQQDPLVQMQQQELQLKAKEVDIKQKKLLTDASEKADRLSIERERLAVQERIAGMNVGAKIATDKANLSAKQQEAKLRIGVDIAREMAQEARTTAQVSKPEETE